MRVRRTVGRWLIPISVFGLLIGALAAATPTGAAPPTPPALQPLHLLQPRQGNVSNDPAGRYGESHSAVNPTNPNNIVATYNQDRFTRSCVANHDAYCNIVTAHLAGSALTFPEPAEDFASLGGAPKAFRCGVFTSFDRGATWQHIDVPGWPLDHPELKDQGDCTVAVGADGSFYVSFDDLNWNDPSFALPTCGIGITKSTDGGVNFGNVVLTGTACDGPKTVADPNDGRVYETSGGALGSRSTANPNDPFVFPNSPSDQYVAVSSDGVSWATPRGLGGQDGATYRNASGRITAANGTVAASFRSTNAAACTFFVGTGAPCLVFQYSTDGGATWSRHAVTNNAASTITGSIMTAADPSTPGHYTVAGLNSSNQFVAFQTTDSGQTWSAAGAPVTDNTTLTKGHTWTNYSSTGVLGLMWKSNQAGGGFKVYAAFTGNGGTSWTNPGAIEVSNGTSPSAPTAQYGPFIGVSDDYSHIAMGPDVAQVTWADWRPGDRQGFVSAVRFLNYDFGGFLPPVAKGAAVNAGSVVPVKFQLSVKGQNVSWATGTVTVDGNPATSAGGGGNTFRYDAASQQYVFNWDTSGLSAGQHTLVVHLDDDTTQSVTVTVK